MEKIQASVTDRNSTYMARGAGMSASCTAGERQAIKALAVKVFGEGVPIKVQLIESISMGKNKFEITRADTCPNNTEEDHASV